jgi:hypothetical protein
MAKRKKQSERNDELKSWAEIATFIELPVSTIHRWAKLGMPVSRKGRHVVASRQDLLQWVSSKRSGAPTAVVSNTSDLAAEMRRSLKSLKPKRVA